MFELPNEILWLAFLVLDLFAVLLVYRLFGKIGLYAFIVLAIITCNLQVMKLVDLFGLTATLGNVLYGSIFLCTDLLGEVHGKKAAQRGVWLGFSTIALFTLYMQIALWFTPAENDWAQGPLQGIFGFLPRIVMASLFAYLASQLHDVWLFSLLKKRTGGKLLWLRNNLSTLISQLIDSSVFVLLAFAPLPFMGGESLSWVVIGEIWLTTYAFKLVVALVDTPFIYWGRRIGNKLVAAGSD